MKSRKPPKQGIDSALLERLGRFQVTYMTGPQGKERRPIFYYAPGVPEEACREAARYSILKNSKFAFGFVFKDLDGEPED